MSRREREVLKVMSLVLKGQRTQAEAGRLLKRSIRQIRRIEQRLRDQGDAGVVHRLRGKPSNRRRDGAARAKAMKLSRSLYGGFGPTLLSEKLLEEHRLPVARETLRQWMLAEGVWERHRRRDQHRSRRERRPCFGEMVQADASEHDWLEGRGSRMVLMAMIDDASSRIVARFYPAETTEAYMDLLGRYARALGLPLAWYTDRDSVFRAESKQDRELSVPTQFSRALSELGMALILAGSPQAKGRVERLWGTLQDRWVKELRLAKVTTMETANDLVEGKLQAAFNRRFSVKPASGNDAHRALGSGLNLDAILSIQEQRTVANDYTIRFENQVYQLLPPVWPGERGGKVIVEKRLDGTLRIRLRDHYLEYKAIEDAVAAEEVSLAHEPIPADGAASVNVKVKVKGPVARATGPDAVHRPAGRSGRTPAEPYPSGGGSCSSGKNAYRPAPNHPWR